MVIKQKWNALLMLGYLKSIGLVFRIILNRLGLLTLVNDKLYNQYNNLIFLSNHQVVFKKIQNGLVLTEKSHPKVSNAAFLRLDDSDVFVFHQVYFMEEYKPLVNIYKSHFGDNPETIIDAGANIGLTAIYFSQVFPFSKIICLEPDESNFKILTKNAELTKRPHFHFIQKALWSSDQNLSSSRNFRDKQSWSIQVSPTPAALSTIKGVSIHSIMKDFALEQIDVLKIDIEGAEGEVFKDRSEALSFLSKVKTLGIEIHEDFVKKSVIEEILVEAGFELLDEGESIFGYNKNLKRR